GGFPVDRVLGREAAGDSRWNLRGMLGLARGFDRGSNVGIRGPGALGPWLGISQDTGRYTVVERRSLHSRDARAPGFTSLKPADEPDCDQGSEDRGPDPDQDQREMAATKAAAWTLAQARGAPWRRGGSGHRRLGRQRRRHRRRCDL